MRNYQLRKTNKELTLKKKKLGRRIISARKVGTVYIYMYIRLCSPCFRATLRIFQNSKKKYAKIKTN